MVSNRKVPYQFFFFQNTKNYKLKNCGMASFFRRNEIEMLNKILLIFGFKKLKVMFVQ